ncbi:MAG: PDZ domain-containing protein [Longimicrobiales bacterium]
MKRKAAARSGSLLLLGLLFCWAPALTAQAGSESLQARERAWREAERGPQVMVSLLSRARLGVSLDVRQGREYDEDGVLVKGVMDHSPAEKAGLEKGDIVTHLDGRSLLSPLPEDRGQEMDEYASLPVQRLMALARELEDGQEVEVRVLRDGNARTVTLQVSERGGAWSKYAPEVFSEERVFRLDPEKGRIWTFRMPEGGIRAPGHRDIRIFGPGADMVLGLRGAASHGLVLQDLTRELGEYFGTERGVLILEAPEGSELGLLPGDVILAIDGREVGDRMDVTRILGSYRGGEPVSFLIMRHGQETRVQGTA